jgi:hypothetical protein
VGLPGLIHFIGPFFAVAGLLANDDSTPGHYLGHHESLHTVRLDYQQLSTYMLCTEEFFGTKISFFF